MKTRTYLAAALTVCAAAPASHAQNAPFFGPTTVHEIELTLSQAEWDSMTPSRGQGGGPMNLEYPEIKSSVTIDGKSYEVGLRFKGNSSYMSSSRGFKRPFKIDLNQYVKTQSIGGQTKLNLNNNFSDRTQIREVLAYEIFRRMGVPSGKTALAKVTLNLGGEKKVLGLYTLAEQLDTNYLKARFGVGDGLLLKPEGARGGIVYLGEDWTRYERTYDPKGKSTDAEKKRFIAFAKLATQADDATFQKEIDGYLDLESFAKFMAATVVTSNGDSILSMGHNFYIWLNPKTNKFQYLPWDLNMAFGGFPIGDAVKLSIKKPWSGQSPLLERVMAIPSFKAAYEKSLREGAKILTELTGLHDTVATAAKPLAALNPQESMGFGPGGPGGGGGFGGPQGGPPDLMSFDKNGDGKLFKAELPEQLQRLFDRADANQDKQVTKDELAKFVAGQGQGGGRRGGGPGGPGGMGGTSDLKAFFAQRAASVVAQLDGKEPGVEPQGGFGPGGGGPGGPGGFDMGAMIVGSFFSLTGATDKQTLAAFEAGWKKNATAWDKNKDGNLTQAEVTAGVGKQLGEGMGPGSFLGGQLWSAMKSTKPIPVATFASRITLLGKAADADKDGTLTAKELGEALLQALPPPDFGGDFGPGGPPPGDF